MAELVEFVMKESYISRMLEEVVFLRNRDQLLQARGGALRRARFGSYLVNMNGGDGGSGHRRVAGRVGERFARADGELLLFSHGHHLLCN